MMRYLLAASALALLGAADHEATQPSAQAQPARVISPQPAVCGSLGSVTQGERALRMRRLGELPPGQAFMAVYRRDERGCIDPMRASERQGATSRR